MFHTSTITKLRAYVNPDSEHSVYEARLFIFNMAVTILLDELGHVSHQQRAFLSFP